MTNIGRVGIVLRGNYNSASTYETLDAVSYQNGLYIAKQNVPAGTAPTNTTYWQKGADSSDLFVSPYIDSTYRTLSGTYIDNSSENTDEVAFKKAIEYLSTMMPDHKGYIGVTLLYVKGPTGVATIIMTPFGQNYCSGLLISYDSVIAFKYSVGSWNWDILKQY